MKIFEIPELTQLAFGTKDVDEARKAYASESPELATQYQVKSFPRPPLIRFRSLEN